MSDDSRAPNKTIGRCIYCGASEGLSDEHIVPFALWGDLTLRDASCQACAALTSRQELKVLRGFMLDWRAVNQSPTRRKKNRPTSITMRFGTDQREWEVEVPAEEAAAFLPLPLIEGPTIVTAPEQTELRVSGFNRQLPDSPKLTALLRKHNATKATIGCTVDPFPFCAMLVKIAYAYAVYCDTDFRKYEMYASEVILRHAEHAWRYVGSEISGPVKVTKGMHALEIREASSNGATYLLGTVWLFSRFGASPYHVVLGKRI